jgi:hypothetical protein
MKKSELKQIIKEELSKIIGEIGEATSNPYSYKLTYEDGNNEDEGYYTYEFETNSGTKYEVSVKLSTTYREKSGGKNTKEIVVAFKTKNGEYEDVTQENDSYRIMATVIQIVKDYLKETPDVDIIEFSPAKSKDNDSRRENMYKAYISKQLPGSKVSVNGSWYFVELK